MRRRTRLKHWLLALAALPGLLRSGRQRALLRRMRAFSRVLPALFAGPLPDAAAAVTTLPERPVEVPEATVRRLADLAALLDRRSALGFCLRRSVLRYHFLRAQGVPLDLHFGARFQGAAADRAVTGHAWVTLDGRPYYEADEHWRDFVVMMRWPLPDAPAAG